MAPRLGLTFDDGEFLRLRQAARSDGMKPTTWAGAQVRKAIPPFELEEIDGAEQQNMLHTGAKRRTQTKGKANARRPGGSRKARGAD